MILCKLIAAFLQKHKIVHNLVQRKNLIPQNLKSSDVHLLVYLLLIRMNVIPTAYDSSMTLLGDEKETRIQKGSAVTRKMKREGVRKDEQEMLVL